ncbi:hypothetical protein ACFPM7_15390 [Actinokineospora guangxiensis]|uniref:Uncharacterized protein n=1 Tax=Actinokineospora guangxiensis TaxID=1490288 RepID=A0ABW0EM65_9PSEU
MRQPVMTRARGGVVRVVAVLAVVVGVLFLQAVVCHGVAVAETCCSTVQAAPEAEVAQAVPDRGAVGLVEICLVVLLAVLFAAAVFRVFARVVAGVPRALGWSVPAGRVEVPELAKLCVLRA